MIQSITHIQSLDLPQLAPYTTLKRPLDHLRQGIFIAEGEKVTSRLLNSNVHVLSILLSPEWFEQFKRQLEEHRDTIDVFIAEKKITETIVGHQLHQSIMALGKLPAPISVDELIAKVTSSDKTLTVMVDGITNAENMGVIVRNCACFGVDALIVAPSSCDPYLRRSVRNSMGNIFQLPIVYLNKFTDDRHLKGDGHLEEIKKLKQSGIKFYAAHPHPKSIDIRNATFAQQSCIVFGAEGHGISNEVLELCDEFVTIPMKEGVDSLNVASASAVMLYEIHRKAIR